ncbi:MAG: response regulator [Myxococcota bacterium]
MSLDLDFRTAIPMAGPLSTGGDRSRARVLIVDDERGPRESLRMILSGSHEVTTAEDAAEALDVLRTEAIDLVTVDLNMPGMKGDELMRTIRAESPQTEIIIITGCGSIETAVEGIRHGVFDYLIKPFDVVQVTASVERALARRASRGRTLAFLEQVGRILGPDRDDHLSLQELEANTLAQERLRAILAEPVLQRGAGGPREGGPSTLEFLEVLAETIETRDLFMRGHARRVAYSADLLSARLCLGREERDHVRMAAFLHDIGKVGATSDVLAGKVLPEADRLESIQTHPAMGERLLRPLGLAPTVTATVRHHHERFDGKGYPDGLAGEDIPLAARIIAIVDAFDAMTCERPYRAARSREEAIAELRANARTQFDPNLVDVFCDLVATGALEALDETDADSSAGIALGSSDVERRRGAA